MYSNCDNCSWLIIPDLFGDFLCATFRLIFQLTSSNAIAGSLMKLFRQVVQALNSQHSDKHRNSVLSSACFAHIIRLNCNHINNICVVLYQEWCNLRLVPHILRQGLIRLNYFGWVKLCIFIIEMGSKEILLFSLDIFWPSTPSQCKIFDYQQN